MPVTAIDPKSALIVIDLQKGIAGMFPGSQALTPVIENTNRLAVAFREKGLPVVLVTVAGTAPGRTDAPPRGLAQLPAGFTDLMPELSHEATDILIVKKTPGAFANTGLKHQLDDLGVTQVVITGVATSSGVDSTARQAYELGYNVTLPTDAMTDGNPETHMASITKVFPRIAETGTTDDVLALLASGA
ncbi:isochorismatase family protein [Sphingomonas oligophenolica]|uniref:Isochorismatase family cysteine hydrolase n=1 Tax=Sphingomonas oligophenolica TaxID=301154 RepID=A0ABU9YB55_9SPHN